MNSPRTSYLLVAQILMALAGMLTTPVHAQLSINTANSSDWQISNGAIHVDWDSTTGSVFGLTYIKTGQNLVDTTHTGGDGKPSGLYMDNSGSNYGSGTVTTGYHQGSNSYIDWWITNASNSKNAFTYSQHFIVQPNDPTLYVYFVLNHSSSDIAGSLSQIQYVFRISESLFSSTYSVNSGLGNQGATTVVLPSNSQLETSDPGRNVENAVVDLHGESIPSGFGRNFYTKYDYASYEYEHAAHGIFGSSYGAWAVIPYRESLVGGPTKQDLIFTNNILIMEALSGHFCSDLTYAPLQGVNSTRIFGPYGFHFNQLGGSLSNAADLYQDALDSVPSAKTLFDSDGILHGAGFVVSSDKGSVKPSISGGGSPTANTAWSVLSDRQENFQYTSNGREYWVAQNGNGNETFYGVAPGNYRLSSYVLGEWGELRSDTVSVSNGQALNLPGMTFTPENFGTSKAIWTIGTPDRSAHEFSHGHANGSDFRNYWGTFNYWQDFQSTKGAQVYYATAVGGTPATNNPDGLNYVQWRSFDPGLYDSSNDSTDNYIHQCPSYVGNPATAVVPNTTIHFATTATQNAQGNYVVLSVGLASADASLTASLNGHSLTWHSINTGDSAVRSGLSGYYQWIAFQWDTSDLKSPGSDNVITFNESQANGSMFDALRMEITNKSADPSTTDWHDYEYLYGGTYTPADDSVPNN